MKKAVAEAAVQEVSNNMVIGLGSGSTAAIMIKTLANKIKAGELTGLSQADGQWTPQINLGIEVRIPENYVPDLNVRLSIYRRVGDLGDPQAIDQMIAELVDRFGPLPESVRNLFAFIELKNLCRRANVEKIDAGPKGISLSFRDDKFARPEQLIGWIAGQDGRVQLRPDHRLFIKSPLEKTDMQVPACREVIQRLISLL